MSSASFASGAMELEELVKEEVVVEEHFVWPPPKLDGVAQLVTRARRANSTTKGKINPSE